MITPVNGSTPVDVAAPVVSPVLSQAPASAFSSYLEPASQEIPVDKLTEEQARFRAALQKHKEAANEYDLDLDVNAKGAQTSANNNAYATSGCTNSTCPTQTCTQNTCVTQPCTKTTCTTQPCTKSTCGALV